MPFGPPDSPSATAQRVPVTISPGLLCASCQLKPGAGHHIARSTTIGTPLVDVTTVDMLADASSGASSATFSVSRLPAPTVCVRVIVWPLVSR